MTWRRQAIKVLSLAAVALPRSAASAPGEFDFDKATRKMVAFDRAYLSSYADGVCRYYGRKWATIYAKREKLEGTDETVWKRYLKELSKKRMKPKRLDCTLYAQEVLKAGMDPGDYKRLLKEHRKVWGARGFAGWSVGYLLTERFNWKAYAIISPSAGYYHYYLRHFKKRSRYPVWKQPDIKIARYFVLKRDDKEIEALLRRHRFGWGFSDGGIHTWITSRTKLKECHYDSGPSKKYEIPGSHPLFTAMGLRSNPLFKATRFVKFEDYGAHLVVFPPAERRKVGVIPGPLAF